MAITYTRIPFLVVTLFLLFNIFLRRRFILFGSVFILALAILFFTPMGLRLSWFSFALKDINAAQKVIEEKKQEAEERKRLGIYEPEDQSKPRLDERRELFQTALSGRGVLFRHSFTLAVNAPALGHGLGSADYLLNTYMTQDLGVRTHVLNIHSVILRTRIETGYPGLVLLAVFVVVLFIELVKSKLRGNTFAALGIMIFLYYGICLLVEPVLSWYRFSGSIFFIVFSLALAPCATDSDHPARLKDTSLEI
jgi:hypothetical protein